jgi:hypothetical protein
MNITKVKKLAEGGYALYAVDPKTKTETQVGYIGVKMPPAEMYPSDSQWGDWAFTCTNIEDANKRFGELQEKLTNYNATSILPSGEKRGRGRPRKIA